MDFYINPRLAFLLTLFALLPLFSHQALRAQGSQGTLRGTVRAQGGAPIAGATVTAKNLETGQTREASSNAEGRFEIPRLEPGRYDLEVSRSGFTTRQEKSVPLSAGQSSTLDFVLESAGQPAQAAPAFQISESLLVGLPLNGRSYTTLATLRSEVSDPFGASTPRGVGSGGLTVSGGRATSNNFLLDGTNIMNTENRVPQSAAGVQLGADAVFQVQVLSGIYGAEYGRSSGGVLNSITRSGTDEFHGTLFEYFRNSKLDARNFFDPGSDPPPFKRNQFGFTVLGPVQKGKTYFTVSYEGLRDRYTRTAVDFFPDAKARQGIITDAQGNVIQTLTVHPKVKELLKIYPLPNSVPVGRGAAQNVSPQFLPTSENFFTTRLDHQISDEDSLFVRYSFDDAVSNFPDVSASHPFWTEDTTRQQYLTLVESHIFNPRLINALRFGYTRPVVERNSFSSMEIPRELFFVRDAPQFGQLFHVGATPFGLPSNTPEMSRMSTFQFADDLLTQRGPHGLKLGFEVHRYHWNVFSSLAKGAEWRFNSLESFLEGGPRGDTSVRVALPGSDDTMDYRQTLAGLYVQDAYQVSPRLLLTLGLRYEFATLIHDKNGRTAFLADPLRDSATQIGPYLANNSSLRNFSPRVGFRWSPMSSGNTVLSGGFGIYYDQLLA
ncbi:MAG: TonB-dependent receptor, partial [Acidobacteria bacterium]|nr:TonB-dependent receptor [Acidobacteriota bacterium]